MTPPRKGHPQHPLALIYGPECPSCARDNHDDGYVCTSDDCPGVKKYALMPTLYAQCLELLRLWERGRDTANAVAAIREVVDEYQRFEREFLS